METISDENYLPNSNIFVYVGCFCFGNSSKNRKRDLGNYVIQGFSSLGIVDTLNHIILCMLAGAGGGPRQCRVFGLYPLDVSSTFSVMIIKKCLQPSLNGEEGGITLS